MPLTPGHVGSSELPGHPLFPDSNSHSAYTYPSLSPSFETLSLNHLQTPLYCQALLRTFPLTLALIETWISSDALLKLHPTHLYLLIPTSFCCPLQMLLLGQSPSHLSKNHSFEYYVLELYHQLPLFVAVN